MRSRRAQADARVWRRPRVLSLMLLFATLSCAASLPASSAQELKSRARAKKVWTEDDLIALRKPWDLFVIEQEKKAEEERAARAAEEAAKKAASQAAATGDSKAAAEVPDTIPALEKRVAEGREKAAGLEKKLQEAEQELLASREDQREAALQAREAAAQELEKTREELKQLEEKLQALKSAANQTPSS